MNFEYYFDKLLNFYNVNTLKDLSEVTNIPISTMSSIKQRNSITALKKKCRELGIYNEIFGDLKNTPKPMRQDFSINNHSNHIQNIIGSELNIDENILKLVDTLCSFAKTNNKFDELKKDLSSLLPKYM